jgi:hypothetical protein
MSFTDTRAELVTALSAVTGVTGYESRPTVIKVGDAWPLLEAANRGPGRAWSATWRVVVIVGTLADERQAMEFTDTVLAELVDELNPVAYVGDQVPVVVIPTQGGDLIALEVPCTAE